MKPEIRDAFWHALARSPIMMVRLAGAREGASDLLPHPMTAQLDRDADGSIWFFMNRDNSLASGGPAQADFSATGHDVFAVLDGQMIEETDRGVFDKLFTAEVAAWFDGSDASDQALLLRFDIANAEVWTSDLSQAGLFNRQTGTERPKGAHERGPIT